MSPQASLQRRNSAHMFGDDVSSRNPEHIGAQHGTGGPAIATQRDRQEDVDGDQGLDRVRRKRPSRSRPTEPPAAMAVDNANACALSRVASSTTTTW